MAEQTTVARPYAKAAFEYARDHQALDVWSQALKVAAAIVKDRQVASLLGSPKLSSEQKVALLSDMLSDDADDAFKRFLVALADQRRLMTLDAIAEQFEHLRAEHEQRIDVTVVSAYKLDSKQQTKLANALKKRLNREISITTQVDKSLIGGVILRAGDTVIDGSVRGRLNRLSEALTA
ncbi:MULTISPECIES: F0F1 ATP synthase subunit delta [unclassified Halomonas]|uniref:F0F1 ATP synthase subunit delta n=1 Tax=unclassified Halomonas TaxID=2609666 RepID=UPI00054AEFA5|nr:MULTISPECIES: F0F1 ATP synthase subunit delta [unclassified Halomonas]ATH77090.1 F0F1 ATP synthase subunit delta [Halomonas hydrothermalis]KHJ51337.1 ATP synthase F0F1 subunit delta [Halomonas hydrothermalis]UDM07315.1 F0F1 ATP synthase subunit delta [Halomonas sp. NyZ770]